MTSRATLPFSRYGPKFKVGDIFIVNKKSIGTPDDIGYVGYVGKILFCELFDRQTICKVRITHDPIGKKIDLYNDFKINSELLTRIILDKPTNQVDSSSKQRQRQRKTR